MSLQTDDHVFSLKTQLLIKNRYKERLMTKLKVKNVYKVFNSGKKMEYKFNLYKLQ